MSKNNEDHAINAWIRNNYGSKRGFLRTWKYKTIYQLGGFREYRNIDWDAIERLVFVCKGNICRSAYAEAVARSLDIKAVSCGVQTRADFPANEDAVAAAERWGVDLASHRTTRLQDITLNGSDLILAMEPWHIEFMRKSQGEDIKYSLLGLWANPNKPYIPDPYGHSPNYFDHCFKFIEHSVHAISEKL